MMNAAVDLTIRQRIKIALTHLRLTKADLARITGFSRTSVTSWLHDDPGKRIEPTESSVHQIAQALRVHPEWLRSGSHEHEPDWLRKEVNDVVDSNPQRHTAAKRWAHTLRDLLYKHNTDLSAYIDRSYGAGVDSQYAFEFDYLSPRVIAEFVLTGRAQTASLPRIHTALWSLSVARKLDSGMGFERLYRVYICNEDDADGKDSCPEYQQLREQAKLFGVELICGLNSRDVAYDLIRLEHS